MAVTETSEWMIVHCEDCQHEWAPMRLPAPAHLVAKALKGCVCPNCHGKSIYNGPTIKSWNEGDLLAWLRSGDTGASSETIASVLSGKPEIAKHPSHPYDPSDFGRCYRLLKKMPGWRERMPEVAAKYPSWKGLVGAWDELTALYEEELPRGTAPKLYARMQALIRDGVPELFGLIVTLAGRRGRIPVGQWDVEPVAGWRLRVNGTAKIWDGIPAWSALIERGGLPLAIVDPGGGTVIGGSKDACIDMLQQALNH